MTWEKQLPFFLHTLLSLPYLPSSRLGASPAREGDQGFLNLWLSRGFFPCMKDSDGLDPDGIGRLLLFVRLSQASCENLVCLLLCKIGLPDSCALLLSRWFCRTYFEFLAELIFFFTPTFCKTHFAAIPIRGTYTLCLIQLFPESHLFYLLNNHHQYL